jgi:hypothetical protein
MRMKMKILKGKNRFIAFLLMMLLGVCFPAAVVSQDHDHHSLDAVDGDPADAVFVDNAGNVGIGKTNPQVPLDVIGGIRATVDTYQFVPTGTVPYYQANRCPCDLSPYAIECGSGFYGHDNVGANCFDWTYIYNPPPEMSQFSLLYVRVPVTVESTEFKLDAHSGNVGIGIENPAAKLSVEGTIHSLKGGFKFPDGTIQKTAHS